MLSLLSFCFRLVCFALPPWCCLTGAVCQPISGSISTAHLMCVQSVEALLVRPHFRPIWKSLACTLPGASATGSWPSNSFQCFVISQAVSLLCSSVLNQRNCLLAPAQIYFLYSRCSSCQVVFGGLNSIKSHIQTAHCEVFHKCPNCPMAFKSAQSAQGHITSQHPTLTAAQAK